MAVTQDAVGQRGHKHRSDFFRRFFRGLAPLEDSDACAAYEAAPLTTEAQALLALYWHVWRANGRPEKWKYRTWAAAGIARLTGQYPTRWVKAPVGLVGFRSIADRQMDFHNQGSQ